MWNTIDRPGYFGHARDKLQASFNREYGKENWRIAWEWGNLILDRPEALQLYEDGYYHHLKNHPEIMGWISTTFSDVYDTAPSNVAAGFSYSIQETPSNHLHDVAVRRALMRNGSWFKGDKLLEIRSVNGEGWSLSPSNIPFHLPEMIYPGQTKYKGKERDFVKDPPWWKKLGVNHSVEEFYQQNKVLQIKV